MNIYNIPDTVYQKCISTNTQNNLHTIFNAKYYDVLREQIDQIKKSCISFANIILPDNENRNEIIVSNLLYDILYSYITDSDTSKIDNKNQDDTNYIAEYTEYEEYEQLFVAMAYFIQCSKKAIDVPIITCGLMNNIIGVLKKFTLHNKVDVEFNEVIKGYNYGATAQTYILENNKIIIKAYNDKLRWTVEGHNDSNIIFEKELEILKKGVGAKLIDFDRENKTIKMSYCGESLYNNFILPIDWKEQVIEIFRDFSNRGIYYSEFKIQNILVLGGKITFIDFGLAQCYEDVDNSENCNKFIRLLSILSDKFSNINDKEQRYQLYSTFVHNMKIINK